MQTDINYQAVTYTKEAPFSIVVHELEELREQGLQNAKLMEHWHPELEIDYLFENYSEYTVNGKQIKVNAGEFIIIESVNIHSLITHYENSVIKHPSFTLQISEDLLRQIIPNRENMIFQQESVKNTEEIRKKLLAVYQYFVAEDSPYKNIKLMSLVYDVIYSLCTEGALCEKTVVILQNAKNVARVRDVMEYIHEHYKEELRQEQVANQFHFSRGHLAKIFRENTGITFREYVSQYRMEIAKNLLTEKDMSVTEAAMEAGFSDTRRFILAFKETYGTTPFQYKRKMTKR